MATERFSVAIIILDLIKYYLIKIFFPLRTNMPEDGIFTRRPNKSYNIPSFMFTLSISMVSIPDIIVPLRY